MRYGLITGLISIIISFGLNIAHLEQSPAKWLTLAVMIAGIVLGQQAFKKLNGEFMSYGQGLGVGMVIAGVSAVLSAAFSYIYVTFIDSEMTARLLDKARADMEAQGKLSDAQIDQAMHWTAMFMQGPALVAVALVGGIMMGLLVSLITAAVLKNPKPEFE
jgi:predicted amino acid-binding ACT domain protein